MSWWQLLINGNWSNIIMINCSVRFMLWEFLSDSGATSVPLFSRVSHHIHILAKLLSSTISALGLSFRYRCNILLILLITPLHVSLLVFQRIREIISCKTIWIWTAGARHGYIVPSNCVSGIDSCSLTIFNILLLLVSHVCHRHLVHWYDWK